MSPKPWQSNPLINKPAGYLWMKKGYGRRYFETQIEAEDVVRLFGGTFIPLYAREPIPDVENDVATGVRVEAA
jgi:hypothetical protein